MVPIRSFPDYMLFVMYFPQLVAGPIARAVALIPQVVSPRAVTRSAVIEGLWLVLWGLFKKMVIADNLAPLVDATFELEQAPSGGQCLLTLYAFAFQIYCDFSGYTDIARGLARLMGFQLALNFALPYTACNPVEFWQRWHISLSTWFRDYLYIPLGGNRHGLWKTCRNLLLTMLLGGLWHGAAWNFIIWGLYHGVLLVLYRLWATLRPAPVSNASRRAGGLVSGVIMFHFTCLGWLFFRATSVEQIQNFLEQIFTNFSFNRDAATMVFPVVFFSGILWIFELWLRNNDDPRLRPGWNRGLGPLTVFVLILSIMFLAAGKWQQFIYFQF
jgi:D-alanyl-lipoteichoic acid acyltransferase DltB (MBOAT superfamily)